MSLEKQCVISFCSLSEAHKAAITEDSVNSSFRQALPPFSLPLSFFPSHSVLSLLPNLPCCRNTSQHALDRSRVQLRCLHPRKPHFRSSSISLVYFTVFPEPPRSETDPLPSSYPLPLTLSSQGPLLLLPPSLSYAISPLLPVSALSTTWVTTSFPGGILSLTHQIWPAVKIECSWVGLSRSPPYCFRD